MVTRNFLILLVVLLGVGCTPQCEKKNFGSKTAARAPLELKIEPLAEGSGPELRTGQILHVHYRAWKIDTQAPDEKGDLISDTYSKGAAQKIRFGKDELMQGWAEGLPGMRSGSKRRLFIPANMAFGDIGAGERIPKGTALIYEIEVVALEDDTGK